MVDFVFVLFIVFGYRFGLIDLSFLVPLALLMLSIVITKRISIFKRGVVLLQPEVRLVIYIMVVIFFISMFSSLVNFTQPIPEYVLKPVKIILISLVVYFYLILRKMTINRLLVVLSLVALSHSIVIYLQYVLDFAFGFKQFLYHPDIGTLTPYRKPGLATGFPTGGLISAVGAFISFYLYYQSNQTKWIMAFLVLSLSVFLSARSAMYLFLLIIPFLLVYFPIYYRRRKHLVYIPAVLVFAIVTAVSSENQLISGTVNKMFANVINYVETGSFHDYSTRHLVSGDHLSAPDDISIILIGNSLDKSSGFQPSDISFIRVLWSNGILALVLYIVAFLVLWYFTIQSISLRPLKVLFFSIFFITFAMLFKGPYLFSSIVGPLIILLFSVAIANKHKR